MTHSPEHAKTPPTHHAEPEPVEEESAWRRIAHAMRPHLGGGHIMVAVLCAALGFGIVVQMRQTSTDTYANLRQDELIRLLDSVSVRTDQLETRKSELTAQRDQLKSASDSADAARELAQQRAETQGILAGTLPATGAGVVFTVLDPDRQVKSAQLLGVMEELRNSGAEVIDLNGVRLTMSSWFEDGTSGIVVDSQAVSPPYIWTAIGDPETLASALAIHGGAMTQLRAAGATATVDQHTSLTIDSTASLPTPRFATPMPVETGSN